MRNIFSRAAIKKLKALFSGGAHKEDPYEILDTVHYTSPKTSAWNKRDLGMELTQEEKDLLPAKIILCRSRVDHNELNKRALNLVKQNRITL